MQSEPPKVCNDGFPRFAVDVALGKLSHPITLPGQVPDQGKVTRKLPPVTLGVVLPVVPPVVVVVVTVPGAPQHVGVDPVETALASASMAKADAMPCKSDFKLLSILGGIKLGYHPNGTIGPPKLRETFDHRPPMTKLPPFEYTAGVINI